MSILIVASTEFEITAFRTRYPEAACLITGVGAPIALYHLMDCIEKKNYQKIIQVGVAGSFEKEILLGDVVSVKSDCFADIGLLHDNQLISHFELGLASFNEYPFNGGELINPHSFEEFSTLKSVKAVTVNLMMTQDDQIDLLYSKYHPSIETMEGAALHYVCLKKNIPFIQIRGISNYVGERDKTKWKMKEAMEASNQWVIDYFQKNNKKNY